MRRLFAFCLFLGGCQDYAFEQVCPAGLEEVARTVPALTPTPADILFVVDNSGSMADEQANLAANFGAFIDVLAGSEGDYRIAVITTDQGTRQGGTGNGCRSPNECEGLVVNIHASESPFNLVDQEFGGCAATNIEHGCFRGPNPSLRVLSTASQDPATIVSAFADNVSVGSCGSGTERGLLAMEDALERARTGCNAGFLRDDANLVVVFVSDESDSSPDNLERYRQSIIAAKDGDASKIRVAAVVGAIEGAPAFCRADATGAASDQCGALICDNPPPLGNLNRCNSTSECDGTEQCLSINGQQRCANPAATDLARFGPEVCSSCTYFEAEDCCSSEPGFGYVEFARTMGTLAAGAEQSCVGDERRFCVVDAICQSNFSETLATIARELVASNRFTLDPPAENPDGVVVQLVPRSGAPRELERGTEFVVSANGTTIDLLGSGIPTAEEGVEIFYLSGTSERSRDLRGACTSTTAP